MTAGRVDGEPETIDAVFEDSIEDLFAKLERLCAERDAYVMVGVGCDCWSSKTAGRTLREFLEQAAISERTRLVKLLHDQMEESERLTALLNETAVVMRGATKG